MAEHKSDNAELVDERITQLFPFKKAAKLPKPGTTAIEHGFQTLSWWLNGRRRCHKHTVTKRHVARRKIRH
ncbi:hypothetical protein [Thalassotalea litorea]|uniref:hypothetical protein n=1 Tax=Thalassotalea litorea TaxID=2020715 RepID=UPI0037356C93